MVPRQAFVNKIRELGFAFKAQQRRTYLYRQTNGLLYIAVPKSDLLEEEWVAIELRRTGQTKEQVQKFIGEAKT
jgi:hypothetical protein